MAPTHAGLPVTRRRRALITSVLLALIAGLTVPAAAAPPDPLAQATSAGMRAFLLTLDGLGDIAPLSEPLPATATTPAGMLGLDAGLLSTHLSGALDAVEDFDDLDGEVVPIAVGGVSGTATLSAEEKTFTGGRQHDVILEVLLERTVDVPLAYLDGLPEDPDDPDAPGSPLDVSDGVIADVAATFEASFAFRGTEHDTDGALSYEFYVDAPNDPQDPQMILTVEADDEIDFVGRYGFTATDVAGSAVFDGIEISVPVVDPDGSGRVTIEELVSTLASDLVGPAFTGGAVDVALTLDSDLLAAAVDATFTSSEGDLTGDAAYPPTVLTTTPELEPFGTVNADDALLGVGQAAVALRSAMGQADARLPFVDGYLSDLYDPGASLFEFAELRGNALLVCGAADTIPPDGEVLLGGTAYCQAFTAGDVQAITWSATNAAVADGVSNIDTAGLSPTANVRLDNVISLPLEVSVDFTPVPLEGESPESLTAVPRFETAQELRDQLVDEGFTALLAYDGTEETITFGLQHATEEVTEDLAYDVRDTLQPRANIAELTVTPDSDTAEVTMRDGVLDTVFGVRLGELDDAQAADAPADPFTLQDRFVLDGDGSSIITIGEVAASEEADFEGRVGYLPVTATTDDLTVSSGESALDVQLAEGRFVISDLVADLEGFSSTADLTGSMTLDVAATTPAVAGTLAVTWDVPAQPFPDVDADPAYDSDVRPFDVRATVTGVVTAAGGAATTTMVDAAADLLTAFGLEPGASNVPLPATLFNTTQGTMCQGITVVDATTLRCDEALAGGDISDLDEADPLPVWTWQPGDVYQVRGDLDALRDVLLGALLELAGGLSVAEDPVIPLVGSRARPAGTTELLPWGEVLAPQFAEVVTAVSDVAERIALHEGDPGAVDAPPIPNPAATLPGLLAELSDELGVAVSVVLEPHDHPDAGVVNHLVLEVGGLTHTGTAEAPLRLGLADTLALVQPEASTDPFVTVEHSSTAALRLGVPLAAGVPPSATVALDGTGIVTATVSASDDGIDLRADIGAMKVEVGTGASRTGTHSGDAANFREIVLTGADVSDVSVGDGVRNLTAQTRCTVDSVTPADDLIVCDADLVDGGDEPVELEHEDRIVVHESGAIATGTHTGGGGSVLEDDAGDLSGVSVGDVLVNTTTQRACRVGAVTTDAEDPDTATCQGGGITWAAGHGYAIHPFVLTGLHDGPPNTTHLYDPTVDFDAIGVVIGDTVTRLQPGAGQATPQGACEVTAIESRDGNDHSVLVCEGLSQGQRWKDGTEYQLGGHGVVKVDGAGTLAGTPGDLVPDFVADAAWSFEGPEEPNDCGAGFANDACARLSIRSAPTDGSDPSYLGTVGAQLSWSAFSILSTDDPVSIPQPLLDELGVTPLDWSLLPAGLPFVAFAVGDAVDGEGIDSSIPLLGNRLDGGADLEFDLFDLTGELSGLGSWLAGDLESYAGDDIEAAIATSIASYLSSEVDDPRLDGLTPVVEVTCAGGGGNCNATDGPEDVESVDVSLAVLSDTSATPTARGCADPCGGDVIGQLEFEVGLPGVPMEVFEDDLPVESLVGWTLDLAFGLSRDLGPYVRGGAGDDLTLAATAQLSSTTACEESSFVNPNQTGDISFVDERCFDAFAGLLPGTLFDAAGDDRSQVDLLTRVSLPSGPTSFAELVDGFRATRTFEAEGNVDLLFKSHDVADLGLPALLSTIHVGHDPTEGWGDVRYADLVLDMSTFVERTLGPILDDIQAFLKPIKPVVDITLASVPIVSELSQAVGRGPVTFFDLLDAVSSNDLTMVGRIIELLKFASDLPNDQNLLIRLADGESFTPGNQLQGASDKEKARGGFKVKVEKVSKPPCEIPEGKSSCTKKDSSWNGDGGKASYDNIAKSDNGKVTRKTNAAASISGAGVTFPFLDDVNQIYGLLVGVDATLVRFDAGTLRATAGMSVSFGPFMAGPVPMEVNLGGSVTLEGRLALGYDTRGFTRAVRGEDAINGTFLLDGLFLDDLDSSGKDVDEIKLIVKVSAGASASLKIIKVGLEAVVIVTIALNLNDQDGDGKLYVEEIINHLENPICLFDVKGTLEFILQLFFEINLFITKLKFTQILWQLKPPLTLFEVSCEQPEPVWANASTDRDGDGNNDLTLHAGPLAGSRNIFTGVTNEKFTVRQLTAEGAGAGGGTDVEVTFNGIPLPYTVPEGGIVYADTAGGNDTVRLLPGATEDGSSEVPFTLDSFLTASEGRNRFEGGDGQDILVGGSGRDTLRGGKGDDVLIGRGDDDVLDGGTGDDVLYGGAGDDRLIGSAGADLLHGGSGDDTVDGGPGLRSAPPGGSHLLDLGNVLIGGSGDDTIQGGPSTDHGFGDDVPTSVAGVPGNVNDLDTLDLLASGGAGRTALTAVRTWLADRDGTGASTLRTNRFEFCATSVGSGSDTMAGHDGDDRLYGGGGDDVIEGGAGADLLCGNDGDDTMQGGRGNDELWGGDGHDRLYAGRGTDRMHGGAGDDLLVAEEGRHVLIGGTGADQLLGADGINGAGDLLLGDDVVGTAAGRLRPGDTWPTVGGPVSLVEDGNAGAATACAAFVVVIAGELDVDGDRSVTSDDDGRFEGYRVIDGRIDVNGDEVVDGHDNGLVAGEVVLGGRFDLDRNGTIQAATTTQPRDSGRVDGGLHAGTGDGDCLIGGSADDRLFGGDGGDHLDGGAGEDLLEGNLGDDLLRGGPDDDLMYGGDGDDTMFGDSGDDAMYGGAGDDEMYGGLGVDHMEGNQGDDEMWGGAGDDTMLGGSSDHVHPARVSAVGGIDEPAGSDVLYGDAGQDLLFGDNVHIETDGTWTFWEDQGAAVDPPSGWPEPADLHGDDELYGGPDDDVLVGQLGDDLVDGGDGHDLLAGDHVRLTLPNGGWTSGAPAWHAHSFPSAGASSGPSHWPGGAPRYDVTLIAPELGGEDHLVGDTGDDHGYGGAGDDLIEGGVGDDYLEGNGGADEVYGLSVAVDATASSAAKTRDLALLAAGASDQDVIVGGSSATHPDVTTDTPGAADEGDFLRGNAGQDVIAGDNAEVTRVVDGTAWGVDPITGGHARAVSLYDRTRPPEAGGGDVGLPAVSGDDILIGDGGSDRLFGQGGDDLLRGNDGDDLLEGNQGDDWLEGNDGDDDLIGGSSCADGELTCAGDDDGSDLLYGGADQDVLAGDNAVILREDPGVPVYLDTGSRFLGFATDRWVVLQDIGDHDDRRFGGDRISGGTEADVAFGQHGDDWMSGGPGGDYLEGGSANDGMFGDRFLSAVGGVSKVRERFGTGDTPADVLVVPQPLRDLDAALPGFGLPSRLDGSGAVLPSQLRQLEGLGAYSAGTAGQIDGQDDMVGGSRLAGTPDGDDLMWGDGDHDAMTGDNADVPRGIAGDEYVRHTAWYAPGTAADEMAIVRDVTLHDDGLSLSYSGDAIDRPWGDDYQDGGTGDDVMYGQDGDDEMWGFDDDDLMWGGVGDDAMFGGHGDDGMLGDRGTIVRTYLLGAGSAFPPTTQNFNAPPFLTYDRFQPGRLHHVIESMMAGPVMAPGGDDLMRGGPDHDAIHGGPGDDRLNGDSGGDILFGGDGHDSMWGGEGNPDPAQRDDRGPGDRYVDYLFGGHGDDLLDYRPRLGIDYDLDGEGAIVFDNHDRYAATVPYWHPDADDTDDDEADESRHQNHQGIDWMYGGWDRDLMQGDVTANGPNAGDRMLDWTGAYNLYTACNPAYGGHNDIRALSPQMISFIEGWAWGSGAAATLNGVTGSNQAGFRNLGLVYQKDNKHNSGAAYRDFDGTPGHFYETGIDCS